jgi:hypothetical protein
VFSLLVLLMSNYNEGHLSEIACLLKRMDNLTKLWRTKHTIQQPANRSQGLKQVDFDRPKNS